jgi:hypothetical protein
MRPAAARKLAGYYKRLRSIIPESVAEEEDLLASAGSHRCSASPSESAPSTALGCLLPCDSCASAQLDLLVSRLDRSLLFEPPAVLAGRPIEPLLMAIDRDDTYNRAARTIQNGWKGQLFFQIIMKVVRLNREFKREEQLALRNRQRKLGLEPAD